MASTMCAYSLDHTAPDCSWFLYALSPENIFSKLTFGLLVKTFSFFILSDYLSRIKALPLIHFFQLVLDF